MKIEVETSFIYKSICQVDADAIDRLNNRYTAIALIACFLMITAKIYVGHPINCWGPTQFQSIHFAYVNSICWLQGTYYLPTKKIEIPDRSVPRTYFISYYQWTSLILLIMAALFMLPSRLWHGYSTSNRVNLKSLIKMIKHDRHDDNKMHSVIKLIQTQLDIASGAQRRTVSRRRFPTGHSYDRLVWLLFIVKLLYLINSAGQLIFLIHFLSLKPADFDLRIFDRFSRDPVHAFESSRFPRVAMCDFMIRELGSNQHWYTVQCNLPINIFNEVIFLSILFWLFILIILNALSVMNWIISLIESNRKRWMAQTLRFYESVGSTIVEEHSHSMENGFLHYIGLDGFITLYMIGQNTDELFVIETIGHLHRHYRDHTKKKDGPLV